MIQNVEGAPGGRNLLLETGRVARQAGGSCWLRAGDTVLLAAATMAHHVREGMDFFPLTCDYEERKYSVGKIPGGFIKRGGRPTEKGILTSRLIDRPCRPLFPSGMRNEVQVIVTTLSVDPDNPSDTLAVLAASTALAISDVPWNGPIGCVRIGRVGGEFVVQPTLSQQAESDLDLVVAGTESEVNMLEMGANEVSEAEVEEAIALAQGVIREQCALQRQLAEKAGKPKREVELKKVSEAVLDAVRKQTASELRQAIQNPDKAARESGLSELQSEIVARLSEAFPEQHDALNEAVGKVIKEQVRGLIVEEGKRPDGRTPTDIRTVTAEVGLLPRTHGSGLFTRGQTQILTTVTLGSPDDAQDIDGLEGDSQKRYMHFYNFPPYSVGETKPLRAAGRREIGHGALAERSLLPVLPSKEEFPYVLQLTSETLESNGSSSMGSACGSTLALMDAGVPIKAPVSGIAMGLITQGDQYRVLSDIQGMEDFSGDMDFKVAGTRDGITAIQLDAKISGLTPQMIHDTLEQAKAGREHILQKMLEAIEAPRSEMSRFAPKITTLKINPDKIGAVIGPGGKTIKAIEAETGADISIEQDGTVAIAAADQESGDRAVQMVRAITAEVGVGELFTGKVTRLMGMGAFVEFLPGKEGLVHTQYLSEEPVRRPDDVVKVGDEIKVRVIEVDPQGRVNLSAIHVEGEFDPSTVKPREERGGPRGGGRFGDRGGRDRDRGPRERGFDRGDRGGGDPDRGFRGRPDPMATSTASDETPKARFRPRR